MKRISRTLIVLMIIFSLVFSQSVWAEGSDASTSDADLQYLKSMMDMIKEKYKGQVTDQQLLEGALKGMFDTMDPYTTYFTKDEASDFLGDINGTFEGIGAMLEQSGEYVVIVKVFSASPAEQSGLLAGDKIIEVDGKSMAGMTTEQVVAKVRGKAGTKVVIGVTRNSEKTIKKIEIVRASIKINPVTYKIKDGIGYINLETFNGNASDAINSALAEMDKQKVTKIILDLRNNPGGLVDQAVAIARKFVPEGLITRLDFKSESLSDQEYFSDLKKTKYKLAVLVNENSASASEILAGAIQDTKAGTLIGTQTFGKAKVQGLTPILSPEAYKKYEEKLGKKIVDAYELYKYGIKPADDEIIGWTKITTGEYTTPKGRMIDLKGITPDILIEKPVLIKNIDPKNIQSLTMTSKPTLNSEGIDVYNAEKILTISGYDLDAPDTKLDKKTYEAIKKFQKDSKLSPSGILDFSTQKVLNAKFDSVFIQIDKQYAKAVQILQK